MIEVTLTVASDVASQITVNWFDWMQDGELQTMVEVANRPRPGTFNPVQVYAYDPEIDLPMAETKRAILEFTLNSSGPCPFSFCNV